MHIPGHLAVGYLAAAAWARRGRRPVAVGAELVPVLVGTLTPDVIDKSIKLAGWSPYGRTLGHSALLLALLACVALLLHRRTSRGARPLTWWTAGVGSHLLADACNDIVAGYWFNARPLSLWFSWPYFNPDMPLWKSDLVLFPCQSCYTPLEIAVLLLASGVALARWRSRRALRTQPAEPR